MNHPILINTAIFENEIPKGKNQLECLREALTQEVVKYISGVELRMEYFSTDLGKLADELNKIEQLSDKYQLDLLLSIPQPLFVNKQINPIVIEIIKYMENYSFKNFKVSCGELYKLSNEEVKILKELFNNHKYNISIENPPNEYGHADYITKTLDYLHSFNIQSGYTFDSGNWYWINEDPVVAYNRLIDKTTIFHLKSIVDKTTVSLQDKKNQVWQQLVQKTSNQVPIILEYGIDPNQLLNELIILSKLVL